jgi:hypothetical protein
MHEVAISVPAHVVRLHAFFAMIGQVGLITRSFLSIMFCFVFPSVQSRRFCQSFMTLPFVTEDSLTHSLFIPSFLSSFFLLFQVPLIMMTVWLDGLLPRPSPWPNIVFWIVFILVGQPALILIYYSDFITIGVH